MKSKTLILSSPNENNTNSGRGILTLYSEDDLLKCKLRLYNLPKLTPQCKLGIYHQKQVYTANMLEKSGFFESSFVGDFNMNEDFYCAIINTENGNTPIIAGGTYAGYYFNDTTVFSQENTEFEQKNEPEEQENTAESCSNSNCTNCTNCVYKQFFYSHKTEQVFPQEQPKVPVLKEEKQTQNPASILESITPQFNYIFENYPENSTLNQLIPNGKFVEISENDQQYSIGAIYENNQIKYLTYAIKSEYNCTPPAEIGKHHQWLPLDPEDPLSDGYYLVFQDATDLKIIEL